MQEPPPASALRASTLTATEAEPPSPPTVGRAGPLQARWLDRLGGVASLSCALHCGLMGFAPGLITLLSLEGLRNEAFEWGFFASAVGFALLAGVLGFRKHRVAWLPLGFLVGIALLTTARLSEALSLFEGGGALAVVGGLCLLTLHVFNAFKSQAAQAACCP